MPGCRVVARIRQRSPNGVVHATSGTRLTVQSDEHGIKTDFAFDAVLGPTCTQQELFEACGKPLLEAALLAVSDDEVEALRGAPISAGALIAYGQTGAGKTHCLLGAEGGQGRLNGVLPQLVSDIFRRLAKLPYGDEVTLKASYVEVAAGVDNQVPASPSPADRAS